MSKNPEMRSLAMFEFFAGASPALGLWALGVVVLGVALVYGVFRAGWLKPHERAQLDQNTRARQRTEDPQEPREPHDEEKRSTRGRQAGEGSHKPWRRPGQLAQNPSWKEPPKPDLEKWKESETH
jgi:hypothetical protein